MTRHGWSLFGILPTYMQQLTLYTVQLLETLGVDGSFVFLGNSLGAYTMAVAVFLLTVAVAGLAQYFALSWLASIAERTRTEFDDTIVKIVRSFHPPFYLFLAFWFSMQYLAITGIADSIVTGILVVWLVYQTVIIVGILVEDVVFRHFAREKDETTKSALRLLSNLTKGVMWAIGLLLVLSNFGINISSLLAGAGIAGVAMAFALQGILGDLFSSFSIYFDKPFKVGDFIITGTEMGTVKHIGIKSTRIQALSGEMLTIANQDLTKSRIQNFALMEDRRVVLTFGVMYDTPLDTLRAVPEWVRALFEGREDVRFDRAHFKDFGDSALMFEVVYYVIGSDYVKYMDAQQSINFGLMERLQAEGVSFAYPTRTVHIVQSA